jgi:hypothetical protein
MGMNALGISTPRTVAAATTLAASVLVAGCSEEVTRPPPVTNAGGTNAAGGGGAGDGSSGALEGGGAPALCTPAYAFFDAGNLDVDVSLVGDGADFIGTFTTPAQPEPGALLLLTLFTESNAVVGTPRAFLASSKRAYNYRVRNVPVGSSIRLRVQIDASGDGNVGQIGDFDGYYAATPAVPVTDPVLARTIDLQTQCSEIDLDLDVVRL